MTHSKITRRGFIGAGAAAAAVGLAPRVTWAQGQVTTYNVCSFCDFSGPYADVMGDLAGGRHAVLDWWNKEIGPKVGVNLAYKPYDHRYDTAQVASLWPGVKSELKPVLVLGVGGPDVAALQERLPDDKIPMLMSTAGYGYAWKADPWIYNPRATYVHEATAFFEWYRTKKRGGDAPLKVAIISSEAAPAYVDIHKGTQSYAKENPTKLQVVEVVFTEVQPTDLTTQINRVVRGGAEAIQIQTNTAVVVATKRALQAIGKKVPIMMSSHNGLQASAKAAGGMDQMEGDYEVYGMALPTDEGTEPRKFYEVLKEKAGFKGGWTVPTVMGMNQGLTTVRLVEHAVKKYGADKLDGPKLREALVAEPILSKETYGVLPDLHFTKEAPFPTTNLTVNIGTVEKGKYVTAMKDAPVPDVKKW
jgi:branched-chain amino acid transport system substrate-binding protein